MDMFDSGMYDKLFATDTDKHPSQMDMNNHNMPNHNMMTDGNDMNHTYSMMYDCKVSPFPKETPIGMAYVPYQQWEKPYDEQVALERGTIFPSLDKPFIGEEAVPDGWKR